MARKSSAQSGQEEQVATNLSDIEAQMAELRAQLEEKNAKIEELSTKRGKAPREPKAPAAPKTKSLEDVKQAQYDAPQLAALMRIAGNTQARINAGQDLDEALDEVLSVFGEFVREIVANHGDVPFEKYIAQWLADNKPNAFRVKQAAAVAAKADGTDETADANA